MMFALILAILLSSLSRLALSTTGLDDTISIPARPITFGSIYSSPYYPFSGQPTFNNKYFDESRYTPIVYNPGQINPFIRYPHIPSSPFSFESSTLAEEYPYGSFLRTSRSPQTIFYESMQSATNPDFPHYSVRNYHHLPFPTVDNTSKKNTNHSHVIYDKVANVSANGTSDIGNEKRGNITNESAISGINNYTATDEPKLQLTYLGFAPLTSSTRTPLDQTFRTIMPPEFGIPFYPIDHDRRTPINVGNNLEPILVSPHRLISETTPSSSMYQNYPSSDVHSTLPYSVENQPSYFYSQPPRFTSQPQYYAPYRSQPWLQQSYYPTNPASNQYFDPAPIRSENGYYLIDVKPGSHEQANPTAYRSSNDPVLGLIKPIILPRPILPTQRSLQSGVTSKTGVTNSGQLFNKYQHQNYNTGFETNLPTGHVYSNLHTDRGIEMQNYDRRGEHTFNTGGGLNLRPVGVPGLPPPQLKPVLKLYLDHGTPKANPPPIRTPGKLIKVTYHLNYTLTKVIRVR